MSLSMFNVSANTVLGLRSFFVDIYNHLCRKNYANGLWSPTVSGMTGTPAVSATYQRFGKFCSVVIVISGEHQMSDATISLPVNPEGKGAAMIIDGETGGSMGAAQINYDGDNLLKIKSYWIGSGAVIISGAYTVIGI